jgi:hypothetical protein
MGNYVKVIKPGTNKSQMVEADRVDFYRQYGWEPEVAEVTAKLKAPKKTAKAEPAVEYTLSVDAEVVDSVEEVGTDIKGD